MRESIRTILATDCGSTTTKAILIEKQEDGYRLITRGEAPTTVEAPIDDLTVGVTNAVREVEELSGRRLLEDGKVLTERRDDQTGTDLYLSTSSAGGGLQMTVAGVTRENRRFLGFVRKNGRERGLNNSLSCRWPPR